MFNKNAFALFISGQGSKITLPAPGQSTHGVLECKIDKKNLDGKNPPKCPFVVQVAMKTSLDVFYYNVPCRLNCLLISAGLSKEEFQQYWEKIGKEKEFQFSVAQDQLYEGYSSSLAHEEMVANLKTGLAANGMKSVVQLRGK